MHRLYCYLYHTRDLGLWLVFSPGALAILGFSDADHANDPESPARSTPEAEIGSLAELVFSAGLPLQEVLFQITEREIEMHIGTDSQATEGMVRAGTSRRLAYLRRYQRVSIASLRDVFAELQGSRGRLDQAAH